jgi:glutamyl/glutaminyl-tRNA synthetase
VDLTAEQQAAFEAEGRPAVIRFKIDDSRTISLERHGDAVPYPGRPVIWGATW